MAVLGAAALSSWRRKSPFSLCRALLMAVRVASLPSYDLTLRQPEGKGKGEVGQVCLQAQAGGCKRRQWRQALGRAWTGGRRGHAQGTDDTSRCSPGPITRTWRPAPSSAAPLRCPWPLAPTTATLSRCNFYNELMYLVPHSVRGQVARPSHAIAPPRALPAVSPMLAEVPRRQVLCDQRKGQLRGR